MALSLCVDMGNMRLSVRFPAPLSSAHSFSVRLALVLGVAALASSCVPGQAQTITSFPASTGVNKSSLPLAVTVTMTAAGNAAAPSAFTQGLPNGEFSVVAGGTCSAGTNYTVGGLCTVDVVFKPQFPGVRAGAVVV